MPDIMSIRNLTSNVCERTNPPHGAFVSVAASIDDSGFSLWRFRVVCVGFLMVLWFHPIVK